MQTHHQIIEDETFECIDPDNCDTYTEDYEAANGRHLEPCEL